MGEWRNTLIVAGVGGDGIWVSRSGGNRGKGIKFEILKNKISNKRKDTVKKILKKLWLPRSSRASASFPAV